MKQILNEILEDLIIEKIERDLREVINEELGVATEVTILKNKVYNEIENALKNTKSDIIDDGTGLKEGYFNINAFGKDLTVFFHCYNFRDRQYKEKYLKKYGITDDYDATSSHIYKKVAGENRLIINKISITLDSVNGTIQNKPQVMDSIQHELEHIYQQTKMGKSFGNDNFYNAVTTNMYSKNDYLRHLSNLLYMNNKSEIEGYANGLYAFITGTENGGELDYKPLYFKSSAYKRLQQVYKSKEFIEQHFNDSKMDDAINVYKEYGLTKQKLPSIINYTIKEMLRKFGRVLIKAKEDLMKSGWRSTSGKFYGF